MLFSIGVLGWNKIGLLIFTYFRETNRAQQSRRDISTRSSISIPGYMFDHFWRNASNQLVYSFEWDLTCSKMGHSRPLFLYFCLFNAQLTVYKCSILINFCRWLHSSHGPLVSEATTLPTEPQPLPENWLVWVKILILNLAI